MKRVLDVSCSFILLIILLPLILLIGLLVRLKLGSPVIFKQMRPGLYGVPFYLYKFRTMTDKRDRKGKLLPDQIRLTRFGRSLRKYSLDELPQLVNVLKGELSLVGPRPLLLEYLTLYSKDQARRHHVKPGITGWAQVNGRNAISWEKKFELDIWYVDNHSFLIDLKILFMTLKKVIRSDGINQPDHATVENFKGSISNMNEENG